MRSVLLFQEEIKEEQDDYSTTRVWKTKFTGRGALESLSGLQFNRGVSQEPTTTHRLVMRYRTDDLRDLRIQCAGVNYRINNVRQDEHQRRKYLILDLEQEEVRT